MSLKEQKKVLKEKVIKSVVLFRFLDDKTAFTCSKVEQQTFYDWWTAARFENKVEKDETPALLLLTCFYEDSKSFSCFVLCDRWGDAGVTGR